MVVAKLISGIIYDEYNLQRISLTLESKRISNDQELIQSDPTSRPQNQKGNKYINWQQFTKGTRGKPNEQLFPRQVAIQLPKIYWNMLLT